MKLAQVTAMILTIVLALSVLVQAYLAGAAAGVDADFWAAHKTWIAIFQWLSVPLAIATFFGKHDTLTRLLSIVPIIIIAIQYSSIHLALHHGLAWLAGIHAANAPLLFGVLVLLAMRYRRVA
jgi:MFS-type transporter involved in bile tolerance (Atg22 family)